MGVSDITMDLHEVNTISDVTTTIFENASGAVKNASEVVTTTLGNVTTPSNKVYTGFDDSSQPLGHVTTAWNDISTTCDDVTTTLSHVTTVSNDPNTAFSDITTATLDTLITTGPEDTNIRVASETLEIIYFTVSALSLTFNAVALLVFLTEDKMRRQLHIKFLISQSFVDFLAGLFLLTNTLSMRSVPESFSGAYDSFLCKYWYSGFPLWVTILTSTHNLVALSILKYLLVVHPICFKVNFKVTMVYAMIAIPFIMSVAFYIALFETATGVVDGQCYQISLWPNDSVRLFFGVATYLVAYLVPILTHVYCYGRILLVLYRPNNSLNTTSGTKQLAQRKAVKLLVIVVVACAICLSWNLNVLFLYYLGLELDFQGWSYNLSVILLYTNCLVNPLIYLIFYPDYRKQLLRLIGCWACNGRKATRQKKQGLEEMRAEDTEMTEVTSL